MMLEKLDIHKEGIKLDPYTIHKNKLKKTKDSNVTHETLKLLEENIQRIHNINLTKDFMDMTKHSQEKQK